MPTASYGEPIRRVCLPLVAFENLNRTSHVGMENISRRWPFVKVPALVHKSESSWRDRNMFRSFAWLCMVGSDAADPPASLPF